MAMTMTQKILAAHAGLDEVKAGQLVLVKLDRVLGNDITSPVAIREFNRMGFDQVYDKDKVTMVMDHFAPNKDIKAAVQCKMCRDFCNDKEVTHFYDVGRMGIEHALLPEKGLVVAGDVVIGADSHTWVWSHSLFFELFHWDQLNHFRIPRTESVIGVHFNMFGISCF